MSTKEVNSSQEIPTAELLAKEAKDLLFYAAQEGNDEDMQSYYYGLDIEKLFAFIEAEGEDLSILPAVIADILLRDSRKEIQNALKANPAIFANPRSFSIEDLERIHGLTPQNVVENGRKCVADILKRVSGTGRELREEEIGGVKNMAYNIPDPDVIEAILPLAEKHASISMGLVHNSAITLEQINRIIDVILQEKDTNEDWINVAVVLIAHQCPKLDEAAKEKLASDKDIKPFIGMFLDDNEQNSNGNGKNGSGKGNGKKRKTAKKKREERHERQIAREDYLADLKGANEM